MKPALFYGIGGGLTVFVAWFILHYGMQQIGGFDDASLIETGWRLYKGQKAYVDFPLTTPVSYVLGSVWAFQWFGVNWRAIIDMMALFAAPTFLWSLFLMAQVFGRNWMSLLLALTVQIISPMMAAYWTYNPITAVAAVLYMLSATYWLRRPADKLALISYAAALALMATMKPNVAGIVIVGITAALFCSPAHRWKLVWISLGAAAFDLALLYANHLSFPGMIEGYRSVANRVSTLMPYLGKLSPREVGLAMLILTSILLPAVLLLARGRDATLSPFALVPALVLAAGYGLFLARGQQRFVAVSAVFVPLGLAVGIGHRSLRAPGPWIPIVTLLSGVYGFLSNSEQKLVDMPAVLVSAFLLTAELRGPAAAESGPILRLPLGWNRYFVLACMVFGVTGLAQGVARDRIRSIGPGRFFEYNAQHTISGGFFKGVLCGDIFDEVLKEEANVLQQNPTADIWFGPRMQWGYAAFDKPSPLHEPVIWDPTMYDRTKESFYFNNFLQNKHDLLILCKNDLSLYTRDEVRAIGQWYNIDQTHPLLTLLRLKK